MCNLRAVVRHSPWLAKLTHNTTTCKTTDVLNVRLSAKKVVMFSAVNTSSHLRVVSAANERASVFSATLKKHCSFFLPRQLPGCRGSAWFQRLDSAGGRSHLVYRSVSPIQNSTIYQSNRHSSTGGY